MNPRARRIGTYQGKRVYEFPVRVLLNDSQRCRTLSTVESMVISTSAAEAANWVREQYSTRPETEILVYSVKGGVTRRYVGWESAMGSLLLERPHQLSLDFGA